MVMLRFAELFRRWRRFRRLSQLDLALAAGVSQRHISWLETGRSQPSRQMVMALADALDIPLRERNALFEAAGMTPGYRESRLDEPSMAPVMKALSDMLDHHAPLPAVVIDRLWNIRLTNRSARLLLQMVSGDSPAPHPDEEPPNLAWITFHPEGLRRYVRNWDLVGPQLLRRLEREALACGSPEIRERLEQFIRMAEIPLSALPRMDEMLLPALSLEMEIAGQPLNLFSIIATFGTPQDVTTDELRIEMFYPADEATQLFFERSSQPPGDIH